MRIAIAQMETRAGDFAETARRMVERSRRAADEGVDLLVFPMAALCGVTSVQRADREGFLLDLMECLLHLVDELACPCLVPMLVDTDPEPQPEALLIDEGELRPVRLAARMDALAAGDEGEEPLDALPEVAFRGARLGVAFTYDDLDVYDDYDYDVDVIVFLSGYGYAVDDPSSALGSSLTEGRFPADAEATGAWIVGVGSLGCYDTQVFCGSSFVLAPWGELAASSPSFEEDLLVCDLDPSAEGPLVDPVTPEVYDAPLMTWGALGMGLAALVREAGSIGACVAVTDDLASMLSAVLAVDALGPTNVSAVVAADGRGSDALALVRALRLAEKDVELVDLSGAPDAASARDLVELALAALARRTGRVPLGSRDKTGRALEAPVASASAARIEPFADVYRTDLLALARTRNTISPVVPQGALARVRAPELGPLGPDAADLASPETLLGFVDLVLSGHLEWELSVSDLVAERGHAETVSAIVGRLHDLAALRPARALGPTLSSRTLEEARWPAGLAWRDRPRDEGERLGARIEELVSAPGAGSGEREAGPDDEAAPATEPPEGEIRDLMGYLRDFSAGGPFSAFEGGRGPEGGRHEGGTPPAPGLWNGPFSEN
ncbi:hypothetical protein H6A07_05520 [Olsenella uli]|uniref:nitrilase-related carbon-nitrogen hydrolase n=1 Tax=Olsenella uli TaxID=133926 RepID=UPI0019566C96|nr:nitrilase-related carbon-nitrogen hydrolase [Olsenella uli]MBM6676199.1 hypothetical protein [Olsenella uli]